MAATDTVLVVEDDRTTAELYARYLDDEWSVRIATSSDEALAAIDDDVAIVVLDRRLPDGSGREVLEQIRRRGYACPVVMVTAVEPDFDVLDMPFDEYLVKPVHGGQLVSTVEALRARHDYDETLRRLAALAAKRAALAESLSEEQLAESEQYLALTADLRELEGAFEALAESFTARDYRLLYGQLHPEPGETTSASPVPANTERARNDGNPSP